MNDDSRKGFAALAYYYFPVAALQLLPARRQCIRFFW